MAYLAKKSRKRGGAYKKSRYAKRRMTGGEDVTRVGDTYTLCIKGCCRHRDAPGLNVTNMKEMLEGDIKRSREAAAAAVQTGEGDPYDEKCLW